MAALLFKVFTLALRTAAKPLSNRFEKYVMQHPVLRGYVLRVAQVS